MRRRVSFLGNKTRWRPNDDPALQADRFANRPATVAAQEPCGEGGGDDRFASIEDRLRSRFASDRRGIP
jgi:hypothetical protein